MEIARFQAGARGLGGVRVAKGSSDRTAVRDIARDEKPVKRARLRAPMAAPWLPVAVLLACAAAQAADTGKGAELYRLHCAGCHGGDGRPVMPTAPDFSRPTTLLKPDLTLLTAIRNGRGAMPAYQGLLRDREILDVVAYLRTFR
jgi:cytochrome c6